MKSYHLTITENKKIFILPVLLMLASSSLHSQDYFTGADLPFLKNAEDRGFAFRENDSPKS